MQCSQEMDSYNYYLVDAQEIFVHPSTHSPIYLPTYPPTHSPIHHPLTHLSIHLCIIHAVSVY